jgi:RNA polymerase sigma factor (sigma-70 family)
MNNQEIKESEAIIKNYLIRNGSTNIADDITQEAFVRILDNVPKDNHILNVAKSVISGQKRKEKSETRHLKELFALYRSAVSDTSFDDSIELKEHIQIIMTTIKELPPKSRQAMALVYIGGLKAKRAAKLIGCDFKVFRDRLDYGLQCLRKKVKNIF